jgi:N-methylhydantoinase A
MDRPDTKAAALRFAVDTGGTFTDLVVEGDDGALRVYKSPTTPSDPVQGILNAFTFASEQNGVPMSEYLGAGTMLMHGTTRGLNAVLTGNVARAALLVTEGHPDILVLREGGRRDIFNHHFAYPDPYIPRSFTFEIPERIGSQGEVVVRLDEDKAHDVVLEALEQGAEAIAVTLLWSFVNPVHELRLRELIHEVAPDLPVTLSHELNPCLREYRRASAAAIDASLKPVMTDYIGSLEHRLQEAGFRGRLLMMTSSGGVLDAGDVVAAPIHSLNSGPSMAPVAGQFFSDYDMTCDTVIVADTGGTSYDVSVVRNGRIPLTRESWIGEPFRGHMTGFPSVDVRSEGAGGGSIAWVDDGGLLHVGPQSAGADPGPACYGLSGTEATFTDACLLLGYLDPDYFLGGRAKLDISAAKAAMKHSVADKLGIDEYAAAAAIWQLATEHMVGAIQGITSKRGIDPSDAVLVGGGGAAGFNSVAIGRRLGCERVVIPTVGPALSAAGALISELSRKFERTLQTSSDRFDFEGVRAVLEDLTTRAHAFIDGPGHGTMLSHIDYSVEARYPHQVWELEVPMSISTVADEADVDELVKAFHATHREVFKSADTDSPVEFESWHARARCRISTPSFAHAPQGGGEPRTRKAYFADVGWLDIDVWKLDDLPFSKRIEGPAIVESDTTIIVVDGTSEFWRTEIGSLWIAP